MKTKVSGRVLMQILGAGALLMAYQNCAPPFDTKLTTLSSNSTDDVNNLLGADFTCKVGAVPSAINAKRLLKSQYKNSVRSLVRGLTNAEKTAANAVIFATDVPDDTTIGAFVRSDNSLSELHYLGYFSVANNFAKHISGDAARLQKFVAHYIGLETNANCATLSMPQPSASCLNAFVNSFGLRVYRRPLSTTERGMYTQQYASKGTGAAGFSAVIFRFLLAPEFLLQLENQGTEIPNKPNLVELTDYELASRLSFHFLNTMPDEQLLADAKEGRLRNPETYPGIVERLINDPKARTAMTDFFEGWLGISSLTSFPGSGDPVFQYLANGITYNDSLADAMRTEVTDFAKYIAFDKNGKFDELFTSDVSFARDTRLMQIYGQTTPAPTAVTEQNAVRLPAGERAGVLTRAGVLANGTAYENPILKGVSILDNFLCKHPPSADSADLPDGSLDHPPHNPNLTTRERWTLKTSASQCVGCHNMINPIGFGLGAYTTLGTYRTQEAIFDEDGQFVRNLPINDDVDLGAILGRSTPTKGPLEYSRAIGSNINAQKCMSQKYFEYTYGRSSRAEPDGCSLKNMRQAFDRTGSGVKDFLRSVALDENFKIRLIEE